MSNNFSALGATPPAEEPTETAPPEAPVKEAPSPSPSPSQSSESVDAVAREVIAGRWGSGDDRQERLTTSAYDYDSVQERVNAILDADSGEHPTYTVQAGDTLQGIAGRVGYNAGWKTLHEKNAGVIGNSPSAIYPGQVISL